jgi:hypothetical protein
VVGVLLVAGAGRPGAVGAEPSARGGVAAGGPAAIGVVLDERGDVHVVAADPETTLAGPGLVVWRVGDCEAWGFVHEGARWRAPGTARPMDDPRLRPSLSGATRALDPAAAAPPFLLAQQLDQLSGISVFRGLAFVTPKGVVLGPRFTVRRHRHEAGARWPAEVAVLKRGTTVLARLEFAEGQDRIAIASVPELAAGLPAGEYTLAVDGGAVTSFSVESDARRAAVLERPEMLAKLLGGRTSALYLQVAVEHLLGQRSSQGKPAPYLNDALDVLESVPADSLTPPLARLKLEVRRALEGAESAPGESSGHGMAGTLDPTSNEAIRTSSTGDATGIPSIDRARALMATGRWEEATLALTDKSLAGDRRAQALADLYRGVIAGESGVTQETVADQFFRKALKGLEGGSRADLFRAHVDYAMFLINRVEDRIHNQAFQLATGHQRPFLSALVQWRGAQGEYHAAAALGDPQQPDQAALVLVGQARLYTLLADLIRMLDGPGPGTGADEQRRFEAGENAATAVARRCAERVADTSVDPLLKAAAEGVMATLAYRARNAAACDKHAGHALRLAESAGSLAGAESSLRLQGMVALRADSFQAGDSTLPRPEARKHALNRLLISELLSEHLREHVPAGRIGLARAGFLARRAYVHEQIIGLLVDEGRADEALRHAESAKARTLQDLLATSGAVGPDTAGRGEGTPGAAVVAERSDDFLRDWPAGVVGLAYFLGEERAWAFLVSSGRVEVITLPIMPSEFVHDVETFLSGVKFQARTMKGRLERGEGYDDSWQDQLHAFHRALMPDPIPARLRAAKVAVIVPHHILHYFPFAALVTTPDRRPRETNEMVHPRFLLDEPYAIDHAPSLAFWRSQRRRHVRPIARVGVFGLADYPNAELPGVENDIANLRAAFGSKVPTVYQNETANETNAKALLGRPGLILFATHGHNAPDQPLSSFLLCYADDRNDGHLSAEEIYRSAVRADMVVMSACYSGLADRSPLPGDDLFGLQRAFLHSGARAVVSGLWDVYDGTGPPLMAGFFRRLAAGSPAPLALADTQREFVAKCRSTRDDPWLHPYFWSVYTVIGDDRVR